MRGESSRAPCESLERNTCEAGGSPIIRRGGFDEIDTWVGPLQPTGGTCYKGTNNGGTCTGNSQCPGGACAIFVGTLAVDLSPLVTGASEKSDASGNFCPSQGQAGCFHDGSCQLIRETGSPAGPMTLGTPAASTLASVFCIPASGNILIDGAASLPGPGATSVPGTVTLVP